MTASSEATTAQETSPETALREQANTLIHVALLQNGMDADTDWSTISSVLQGNDGNGDVSSVSTLTLRRAVRNSIDYERVETVDGALKSREVWQLDLYHNPDIESDPKLTTITSDPSLLNRDLITSHDVYDYTSNRKTSLDLVQEDGRLDYAASMDAFTNLVRNHLDGQMQVATQLATHSKPHLPTTF